MKSAYYFNMTLKEVSHLYTAHYLDLKLKACGGLKCLSQIPPSQKT